MQDNTFSTKQDSHFSEVLNYWFDSFKYFTNKNRFNFRFFDSPQMEMAYFENYDTIQERMEFIKGFKAFDEINKFIKITFNGEKSRCEGFLTELRQSVERLEFSKTECWLKSMIENFENENTQFDTAIVPPETYQMMHELYYLWDDAVSDCNKILALYSNLPSVLPSQLFNQMNTPAPKAEEQGNKVLSVRQRNTINRYREYVEFYIRNIKDLNLPPIRARRDTWKKFNICERTLERAFDEHRDILDTYQVII